MFSHRLIFILLPLCLLCFSASTQIVDIELATEGLLVPRMTNDQRDAISTPINGALIYNLDSAKFNYYEGLSAKWLEICAGPLTSEIQTLLDSGDTPLNILNNGASLSDFIGLSYAGGIIFYIETNGTGLVVGPYDLAYDDMRVDWDCDLNGALGVAIGTGLQNTLDVINTCNGQNAAALCANLILNNYDDWFFPSLDELKEIYSTVGQGASGYNKNIAGFLPTEYWSSTQTGAFGNSAYGVNFSTGNTWNDDKNEGGRVRAIRAF